MILLSGRVDNLEVIVAPNVADTKLFKAYQLGVRREITGGRVGQSPAFPNPTVQTDPASSVSKAWQSLKAELIRSWPPRRWVDVGVVVGCSGGADSVALLRALHEVRGEQAEPRGFLISAHFNHRLRDEASETDARFTQRLAAGLGVTAAVGRADAVVADEATLRSRRYAFLRETAESYGARYVVLAHSADDNVETLLHHLARGSGPTGLAAMPPFGELGPDLVIARPWLSVRRETVRQALREIAQLWREDGSNADPNYQRNWIRRELMPLIESRYPRAREAMVRTIDTLADWRRIVEQLAVDWLDQHAAYDGTGATIRCDADVEPAIVVAAMQLLWSGRGWPRGAMSSRHWKRLAETVRIGEGPRYDLPGGISVAATGRTVELRSRR